MYMLIIQEMNWNIESNPIVAKLLSEEYGDVLRGAFDKIKLGKRRGVSALPKGERDNL